MCDPSVNLEYLKTNDIKEAPDHKNVSLTLIERGIIYFFTRSRVNIENPHSVNDLQRTYFVLRPIPQDVKLDDGLKKDDGNNRLIALPKKVFPRHHRDKFMAFVEKGKATINDLKEGFFPGSEYTTKTRGVQHQPPIMPIAEGVYSITRKDGSSYLTYILNIPMNIDEVQYDLGLQPKGSFIVSVKNPERPGPPQARLPKGPELPKE